MSVEEDPELDELEAESKPEKTSSPSFFSGSGFKMLFVMFILYLFTDTEWFADNIISKVPNGRENGETKIAGYLSKATIFCIAMLLANLANETGCL